MSNNGKNCWNFGYLTRAVAGTVIFQGLGVVLSMGLNGDTGTIPVYKLPIRSGVIVDGIAITAQNTPGDYFDLTTENNVYVPVLAGTTFGVATELAVDAGGKMIPAIRGQVVVAKSVNAAITVDQIITALRTAPYIKS